MSKILVAYFSATGETARLAKNIAAATGGEIFEIKPVEPYSHEDLNWHDKRSRSSVEMADKRSRPPVANRVGDMASYKLLFIGFPIWWYEAPHIIYSFLENYNLAGKTIVPFATSEGSGIAQAQEVMQRCCPRTRFLPGRRLDSWATYSDIKDWLVNIGISK